MVGNRNPDIDYREFPDTLEFIFGQFMKNVYTALPGLVESYEASTRRAVIQPAVRLRMRDGSEHLRPLIPNVPVMFGASPRYLIHDTLERGDPVMLLVSARDIAEFKRTLRIASAESAALFSLRDSVAFPMGPLNWSPASASGLSIQSADGATSIVLSSAGVAVTGASFTFNGSDIETT